MWGQTHSSGRFHRIGQRIGWGEDQTRRLGRHYVPGKGENAGPDKKVLGLMLIKASHSHMSTPDHSSDGDSCRGAGWESRESPEEKPYPTLGECFLPETHCPRGGVWSQETLRTQQVVCVSVGTAYPWCLRSVRRISDFLDLVVMGLN